MVSLHQDIHYALRLGRKAPGFTAIAVLTLALGIGANTTLFSVVKGVLLNPLPYLHSEQLVAIYAGTPGVDRGPVVYLNFLDWQRQNRTFASMAIYRNQDYNLTGTAEAERLSGYMVSAEFFSTLGVRPILGRGFRPDDDQLGAAPVVILGGGLYARKFGSSPNVIGRPIDLNGVSYTIIGVVPADFAFYGRDRDVYVPIGQWNDPSFRDRRISVSAHAIGRLKPGVTLPQAQADMDVVANHLAATFPVADKESAIKLLSMKEDIVGNVQPFLIVLLAGVGFLLLIACANVANLLLARSLSRSREFAVRIAIGAGSWRVLRQLVTESVLLAGLGGALGLLFASVALETAAKTLPANLPRVEEISLDGRVLLFTLAVSILTAIVTGLAPALQGSRVDLAGILKDGGRGSTGSHHRVQKTFVAIEISMAVVLLAGAGLMVRSLRALWKVDPGFNPAHAVTFNLSIPATPGTTSADTRARLRRLEEQLGAIPSVQAVSVTLGSRPMIHDSSLPFWILGRPKPPNENEMPQAMFYLVEAGFARAMGITLERGRFISPQDRENTSVVIDIDDAFARLYFPAENPVGKRVHLQQFDVDAEIVGVVRHLKQWGPGGDRHSAIEAQFFYPFMQLPEKLMPMAANGVAVVLRVAGDPADAMRLVRKAVAQHDSREVIYGVQTLNGIIAGALAARRITMILLSVFSALALLLASVGVYGVTSFVVGRRTHEIGIRMALGARASDVMRTVLAEGLRMALAGIIAGLAAAAGLTRLMANQLFGVEPEDPLTFAVVAVLLACVALAASYLPARRAVRVDPMAALRCE
jgi:putative ABC transport system permease protein